MTCRFCNKVRRALNRVGIPIPLLDVQSVTTNATEKCKTLQECIERKRRFKNGGVRPCDGCLF